MGACDKPFVSQTLGLPKLGLKDNIKNLEILISGVDGSKCPRCGETEFWKLGSVKIKGHLCPRRGCCNCGYTFSILDFQQEGISNNRAARIFNLNDKYPNLLINDALQYGLIEKSGDTYRVSSDRTDLQNIQRSQLYHKNPIYHYLIESLGLNPKRSDFENVLKALPDTRISKIKRDVLWRKYREIAIEIFVCEKSCNFSKTCTKKRLERMDCDVIKKEKQKRKGWRTDIII